MLSREEQVVFVLDLVHAVRSSIVAAIDAGKVPADWDGIELRQYIADKFSEQKCSMDRTRCRNYTNAIARTFGL